MMNDMENLLNRISINPEVCNGKPTIRNIGITVKTILDYLSAGEAIENLLEAYPFLEKADILACLQFASQAIDTHRTFSLAG
jgi:uncharacterized protein (DUF433 family)